MSKKEKFIELVECLMDNVDIDPDYTDALEFWEAFKTGKSTGELTENGKKVLKYMQDNGDTDTNFIAKNIGEGLGISSRSVSGAMRKLITDGYVIKTPGNPVIYSITDSGKEFAIDI